MPEAKVILDRSSEVIGSQHIDPRNWSRPRFGSHWSLRVQFPWIGHPKSPLTPAFEAIMLAWSFSYIILPNIKPTSDTLKIGHLPSTQKCFWKSTYPYLGYPVSWIPQPLFDPWPTYSSTRLLLGLIGLWHILFHNVESTQTPTRHVQWGLRVAWLHDTAIPLLPSYVAHS